MSVPYRQEVAKDTEGIVGSDAYRRQTPPQNIFLISPSMFDIIFQFFVLYCFKNNTQRG